MLVFVDQDFLITNKARFQQNEKSSVYNISSIVEGGINASVLIPPLYSNGQMIEYEDRNFDIWYASYILGNQNVFRIFFSIIYDIYMGKNVYCIFAQSDRLYSILESLIKLIQQRYGINASFVFKDEDLDALQDCDFSFEGVFNLDKDKELYVNMYSTEEVKKLEQEYQKQEMMTAYGEDGYGKYKYSL